MGKYFFNFNDAELYAISAWVANVETKNEWNGFEGKVWDAYMAEYDKQAEQSPEETQPQEYQSVH